MQARVSIGESFGALTRTRHVMSIDSDGNPHGVFDMLPQMLHPQMMLTQQIQLKIENDFVIIM